MTDPYDQETDHTFDQITSPYRHRGGRTVSRQDTTAEDKRAQAWQMVGCSSLILALGITVAAIIIAITW